MPGLLVIIVLMSWMMPNTAYSPPNAPMMIKNAFVMTPLQLTSGVQTRGPKRRGPAGVAL